MGDGWNSKPSFSLLQYSFWLKYLTKICFHTDIVGKGRSVIDFSTNLGYFTWLLYQNSTSGGVFSYNVEYETVSINFSYCYTGTHWSILQILTLYD